MRIAVLSVGLIGGSIGLAARTRIPGATVVGHGRSPERLQRARELGALDDIAATTEDALAGADACFCCGPVAALGAQVAAALDAAGPDCVVTDVGSVKTELTQRFADERFLGGHPLAGGESSGVEHAREDLFDGAAWYLTPSAGTSGIKFERLHRLLTTFGARPQAIGATEHDALMAAISHLPHVLANILVERAAAAAEHEASVPIGPSFRDATRVAGANPPLWEEIYAANAPALAAQVDATIARLEEVGAWLRAGQDAALGAWQQDALDHRTRLYGATKAGAATAELHVTAPNRPGVVADIALLLGRAGVNIDDMSLTPSADDATGLVRLWVPSHELERARTLVAAEGFAVS